jgi:two-component system, OmpR family, alkaline phosphatase synthesis response regulator PhoP
MATKGKILIIDDDPDLCVALQLALEADGFAVRCASQGSIGLEMMRQEKPDLVFLDIMMRMPTEGVWVSEEIWEDLELRPVPVVMLTSISGTEWAGHFPTDRPLRAHMFLDKPVPMSKILEVANRYAGQPSSSASPQTAS